MLEDVAVFFAMDADDGALEVVAVLVVSDGGSSSGAN